MQKPIQYLVNPNQRLVLTGAVIEHFWKHTQKSFMIPESGGQLFARITPKCVAITDATGPYRSDLLSRYCFVPNKRRQRADIQEFFKRGLHYVGDWHTHPQNIPTPSSLDLNSMADCFKKSRHELESFIMVIVGTEEQERGLWVGIHNSASYTKLNPL